MRVNPALWDITRDIRTELGTLLDGEGQLTNAQCRHLLNTTQRTADELLAALDSYAARDADANEVYLVAHLAHFTHSMRQHIEYLMFVAEYTTKDNTLTAAQWQRLTRLRIHAARIRELTDDWYELGGVGDRKYQI